MVKSDFFIVITLNTKNQNAPEITYQIQK